MLGIDPGSMAGQVITYLGGGAGAKIAIAAVAGGWLLSTANFWHEKKAWMTTGAALGVWIGCWVLKIVGIQGA